MEGKIPILELFLQSEWFEVSITLIIGFWILFKIVDLFDYILDKIFKLVIKECKEIYKLYKDNK